jgi:group I intron endonuclease
MTAGIYKITCLPVGKYYIGSSLNIEGRFLKHKSDLRCQKHGNQYLQKAWNKHGAASFTFEILEACDPAVRLVVEQSYLDAVEDWSTVFNALRKINSSYCTTKKNSKNYYARFGGYEVKIKVGSVRYSKNVQTEKEAIELVDTLKKLSAAELSQLQEQQKPKRYFWHKSSKLWAVKIKGIHYGYYKTEQEAATVVANLPPQKTKKDKGKGYHFNKKVGKYKVVIKNKYYGCYDTEHEAIAKVKEIRST